MLQAHHTTKINVFPVETSFKQETHTHTHMTSVALIIDACRLSYISSCVLTYYYYYNNYDVNIYNDNNKVTNKTRQEKRCVDTYIYDV